MKLVQLILFLLLAMSVLPSNANTLNSVFLDPKGNVHLIKSDGKDIQVSQDGKAFNPQLASDGETVAWLISDISNDTNEAPVANELAIYRKGRVRHIKCGSLIRDFWFWKDDAFIAIDCGGMHFAGWEFLYHVQSLKLIDSINQNSVPVEKRPDWANGQ